MKHTKLKTKVKPRDAQHHVRVAAWLELLDAVDALQEQLTRLPEGTLSENKKFLALVGCSELNDLLFEGRPRRT